MKNLAVVLVLIFSLGATAQQVSYPLTCKFSGVDSAGWRPNLAKSTNLIISMVFKQSTSPASAGVPEGFCAWQDRGMNTNEPTVIAQDVLNVMSIFEVVYKGQNILVTAPSMWAAKSKVAGTQITFKVHAETLPGSPYPVLKIDN